MAKMIVYELKIMGELKSFLFLKSSIFEMNVSEFGFNALPVSEKYSKWSLELEKLWFLTL